METPTTSKGRIVNPSAVRRKFGIREGTLTEVKRDPEGQHIILGDYS